jgi:hypothetical protein
VLFCAQGPFNHEARAEVGLPREWYDMTTWPEQEQSSSEVPPPLDSMGPEQLEMRPPVLSEAQLQELRARLQFLLETEATAAGSSKLE